MQPYQEASKEINRQQSAPANIAKKAGSAALGAVGSAALIGRIAPFLSNYLPNDLAMKGLSKINPKMAGFISSSMAQGHSFEDIKEFLGSKLEGESKTGQSKQNGNIIQQYSPELFEFINSEMQKGRAPLEAGALAELQPNFKNIIKKMAGDHKTTFASILQTVFGQGDLAQGQQAQQSQPQQMQQSQGQQPSGNGNALLLQAVQSINQRLGGQ